MKPNALEMLGFILQPNLQISTKGDHSIYTPEMTARTYQQVLSLGAKLAIQGFTVILDAKYDRQSLRAAAIDLAQSEGIQREIIHCTAPESVLIDRLAQRTGDIADATVDLLASQQAMWEDFTSVEMQYVTRIDTTVDSLIQPLLEKLALFKLRT